MVKQSAPLLGLVVCCLMALARPPFESSPDGRWRIEVDAHYSALVASLERLRTQPNTENYQSLRVNWEQIAWLNYLGPAGVPPTEIDNNRAWLADSAVAALAFPEAGLLQRLEYTVVHQPAAVGGAMDSLCRAFADHCTALRIQALANPPDPATLRFLLATELYRQYTLVLGGYFRLDRTAGFADFTAFLTGLEEWSELLDTPVARAVNQHLRLLRRKHLLSQNFASLDRYELYRDA